MGTATVVDGVAIAAYVNGVAVDSEGREVKGAPKQPKDTDPSKQPGALGAPTPEERMGRAIAQAIVDPKGTLAGGAGKPARAAQTDEGDDDSDDTGTTDDDEVEGLPTLANLPDHVAGITDVDELKALRKSDSRKGAKPIYKARLAELSGE